MDGTAGSREGLLEMLLVRLFPHLFFTPQTVSIVIR
jgi:hypothetical protein